MKVRYIFAPAVVLASVIASCNNDTPDFGDNDDKMVEFSITASLETSSEEISGSRTSIDYNPENEYNSVSFDGDETMSVFAFSGIPTGNETNNEFKNSSVYKSTFTGIMSAEDAEKNHFVTIYPYSENNRIVTTKWSGYLCSAQFYIPENQTVKPDDISNAPILGIFSKGETDNIQLCNRAALMRIVFKGNEERLSQIKSLQIKNGTNKVAGLYYVEVKDGYVSEKVEYVSGDKTEIIVTPENEKFELGKAYYIAVRPYKGQYTISVALDGSEGYHELCKDTEERAFVSNTIYTYEITIPDPTTSNQ